MTKRVRIENADSGNEPKILVQTWYKGADGHGDVLQSEQVILPFQLAEGFVHSGQYIIITEVE